MGRGYVIEHCAAALKAKSEQLLYRFYVTDALKAIAQNTAAFAGEHGVGFRKRFAEIYEELKNPRKEEQTGEQIIEHMKNRLANL